MSRHPARVLVAFLALTSALSACGLKQEVKDQIAQQRTSGLTNDTVGGGGATDVGGGDIGSSDTGTGAGADGSGTATTAGGSSSSGNSAATGGSSSNGTGPSTSSGGAGAAAGGGTTTGIDFKNKIVHIALHGPLTGAGVPQRSFTSGTPKYWVDHKLANGFRVQAVAIDDKYNAADALRSCNAAADTNFLIVGGAGTDQISACAQSPKLRRLHVPYLSSGVTEAGLANISTYAANSLTYKQQAPLLIRLAKDKGYFSKKWGMVITGTPNFKDAREAMVSELTSSGAKGSSGAFNPNKDVFLTDKAPSNCSTVATQIRGGGYEVVYFLGQPSFFAQCVGAIGNVPINPVYTGPGPSFGISSVITLACAANATYQGYYLNPSPSWNQRVKYGAPDSLTDDIELGIWGGMQQLAEAFDNVKGPLTREAFVEANRNVTLKGGVLQPTVASNGSPFRGTAAYANEADCAQRLSNTIGIYKR